MKPRCEAADALARWAELDSLDVIAADADPGEPVTGYLADHLGLHSSTAGTPSR